MPHFPSNDLLIHYSTWHISKTIPKI